MPAQFTRIPMGAVLGLDLLHHLAHRVEVGHVRPKASALTEPFRPRPRSSRPSTSPRCREWR